MNQTIRPETGDVLLVVDIQNDFCPGGALAVPDGDAVIPVVNRLARQFAHVILTQDWHPPGHLSFASSHHGRKPFETVTLPSGEQVLWPDHCVQATQGAAFHHDLAIPHAELIIRKGYHREIDSYSAFYENDRRTPTGLSGYLRDRGLTRVFVAGLALDYCVRYSVEDAMRHGFTVIVVEDGCRSIGLSESVDETLGAFAAHGVRCVSSTSIL